MRVDDIVNQLNPDMFRCLITNEWLNIKDSNCAWGKLSEPKGLNNFWTCVNKCPKFTDRSIDTAKKIGQLLEQKNDLL